MKATTKPAATPTPTPKAAGGIKKINLGGITATAPKKTGKEYPALPDPDGEVARLVTEIVADQDALDALDASIEIKKGELRALATPFYFEHNHGLHEIPSSIEARNPEGKTVLVAFQNRYTQCADDGPLVELLGGERAGRFFRQAFELKIAGDKVPEAAVETLIAELQELFARHNASEALTAKATIKPTADFHAARHSQLTVEENLALEKIVPIVVQMKTKGREKQAARNLT